MRSEAANLATLLWTVSTTATTGFLDLLSGARPASGDYQLGRLLAATAIRLQIEAGRRSTFG